MSPRTLKDPQALTLSRHRRAHCQRVVCTSCSTSADSLPLPLAGSLNCASASFLGSVPGAIANPSGAGEDVLVLAFAAAAAKGAARSRQASAAAQTTAPRTDAVALPRLIMFRPNPTGPCAPVLAIPMAS